MRHNDRGQQKCPDRPSNIDASVARAIGQGLGQQAGISAQLCAQIRLGSDHAQSWSKSGLSDLSMVSDAVKRDQRHHLH